MKSPRLELARLIVAGDGTPRTREQLVEQVCHALDNAHEAGVLEGRTAARAGALDEMLAIARGLAQDANARVRTLEAERAAIQPTKKG